MTAHQYQYHGSMPCTGQYRCYKCGKVDPEGHWNWREQTDTCPESFMGTRTIDERTTPR